MNVIQYEDSYKDKLFDFLRNESVASDLASQNMWHDDWEHHAHTLPYKLYISKQYENGVFHIVIDNDKIVGCSGAYVSLFNNSLLIAGTRTWINKEYRNMQIPREFLLPAQKEWAISNGMKAIALTFNEYNSNLIQAFNRKRLGENRTKREPRHIFYNGVIEVPFPVTIQHTKQFVIYENLAEWDFNWESIRFVDNNPA